MQFIIYHQTDNKNRSHIVQHTVRVAETKGIIKRRKPFLIMLN